MGHIRIDLENELHKKIKQKCLDLEYKQEEILPILIEKGLEVIKNRK